MGQKSLEADALSIAIARILDRSKDEQGISFRELEDRSGVSRARARGTVPFSFNCDVRKDDNGDVWVTSSLGE